MEDIDTVITVNNRTIAVERKLLKRTVYYDMGQVQNYEYSVSYVGQRILYMMTLSEHL